jgi:hypothetical protein
MSGRGLSAVGRRAVASRFVIDQITLPILQMLQFRYSFRPALSIQVACALMLLAFALPRLAHAGEIILLNGDRLSGDIIERTRDAIVIEHTALGRINVPIDSIRHVRTDKVLLPATPDAPEVPKVPIVPLSEPDEPEHAAEVHRPAAPPATPPTPPQPDIEWSSQAEIGLNATAGTSDSIRLRAAFRTARSSPFNTFRYDITYRFGEERNKRTQNALTTGVFSEWPFPESPWSMFAQGRYDYSEFQSWDHRLSSGTGFGYRLFDITKITGTGDEVDIFNMKLRGGVGVRKEFGSLDEEFDPEGIAGFELGWRINDVMRIAGGTTAFPSLDRLSEYRIISSIDWIIDIDWASGMALKLGAAHEFESRTDPGISGHDLSVYGTLVISF